MRNEQHMLDWNLAAIALLIAACLATTAVSFWITRIMDHRRDTVVRGFNEGQPLSPAHQRQLLIDWFVMAVSLMGVFAFLGFASLQIARLANNDGVRWLAYAATAFNGWGAVLCLFNGDWLLMLSAMRKRRSRG